jgi:hypothetical protein
VQCGVIQIGQCFWNTFLKKQKHRNLYIAVLSCSSAEGAGPFSSCVSFVQTIFPAIVRYVQEHYEHILYHYLMEALFRLVQMNLRCACITFCCWHNGMLYSCGLNCLFVQMCSAVLHVFFLKFGFNLRCSILSSLLFLK